MEPETGSTSRISAWAVVDLPEPDSPTMPKLPIGPSHRPGSSTPSTAWTQELPFFSWEMDLQALVRPRGVSCDRSTPSCTVCQHRADFIGGQRRIQPSAGHFLGGCSAHRPGRSAARQSGRPWGNGRAGRHHAGDFAQTPSIGRRRCRRAEACQARGAGHQSHAYRDVCRLGARISPTGRCSTHLARVDDGHLVGHARPPRPGRG